MTAMPVWRRPIWLLGHLIALVAVVSFVRLGVWQIDRLHEKQARNRAIAERADGPAVDLDAVDLDDDGAKYQHVTVTGVFAADDDVLIPYRSYEGTVGSQEVTPLVLADGSALLVNRGWVPDDASTPPDGEVTIEGLLLTSGARRTGVDVDGIAEEIDRPLLPMWLQQTAPDPAGDYPILLEPPARDEGPHRSYAIQWFLFAVVVLVGYPVLLRRRMRGA